MAAPSQLSEMKDVARIMEIGETNQAASAAFIQHIRETLQKAQEITQVVSEAEKVADEVEKFCGSIQGAHAPPPQQEPLAAELTREIQTSVVWTQTMLQMCTVADGDMALEKGSKLAFVKPHSAA